MRLRAVIGFCLRPGVNLAPGDEFSLPQAAAKMKIAQHIAIQIPEEDAPEAPEGSPVDGAPLIGDPEQIQSRDPVLPARRGRRKGN